MDFPTGSYLVCIKDGCPGRPTLAFNVTARTSIGNPYTLAQVLSCSAHRTFTEEGIKERFPGRDVAVYENPHWLRKKQSEELAQRNSEGAHYNSPVDGRRSVER